MRTIFNGTRWPWSAIITVTSAVRHVPHTPQVRVKINFAHPPLTLSSKNKTNKNKEIKKNPPEFEGAKKEFPCLCRTDFSDRNHELNILKFKYSQLVIPLYNSGFVIPLRPYKKEKMSWKPKRYDESWIWTGIRVESWMYELVFITSSNQKKTNELTVRFCWLKWYVPTNIQLQKKSIPFPEPKYKITGKSKQREK